MQIMTIRAWRLETHKPHVFRLGQLTGSEMVEDSFEYSDEFDKLYELLIVNMYKKHNIDPYDDNNSFNTFKKIDDKWFAEWLNPMGLELEISDLVNDNVSAEIIELLQE